MTTVSPWARDSVISSMRVLLGEGESFGSEGVGDFDGEFAFGDGGHVGGDVEFFRKAGGLNNERRVFVPLKIH
jgi:hypothetical protein